MRQCESVETQKRQFSKLSTSFHFQAVCDCEKIFLKRLELKERDNHLSGKEGNNHLLDMFGESCSGREG